MAVQTPYLNAIQALPGDTPGEKFRWMTNLIKERLSECKSLEHVVESEKIPRKLVPLVQVHAALMLNKMDHENQSTYEAIAEALKSEDEFVVNTALQSNSFFDGTNSSVTNVRYFCNLFPFVSLNTRTRMIKALASHLANKNSRLAEEFFSGVELYYGLEQALPLLLACNESFIYDTIVKKRIVLSRKLVKQMFRKNPDLVVRYLRLSKPNTDPCARNLHPVNIYDFGDFLAALIMKRLDSFVELYEMHENLPPNLSLSNRCAEAFLKNGKEHLQRKPRLYIRILPLRMISNRRMEAIYAKLFPENVKDFNTDNMLGYLEYYPQDKKIDLLLRSYQQVYGKNILDDHNKVTAKLMTMLPMEERVKQARIKLDKETVPYYGTDYTICWTCYLPTNESIPIFKEEIVHTTEMEDRTVIACRMIYSCKVNNDDQALLQILVYLNNRHKNEQFWFHLKVFETLLKQYDLPQMREDCWKIITDMIMRVHVRKDPMAVSSIGVPILEAAIHHKILLNQPFDQMIDVLVDLKSMRYTGYWNILLKYPEYERLCLEACVNVVSQKYHSDKTPWKNDRVGILFDLCSSIYHFNESHVNKTQRVERVERMSINNYPWLVQAVGEILSTADQSNVYIVENLQNLLKSHEKSLYERLCPGKNIPKVEMCEALNSLKKNPEDVLAQFKEYWTACQKNWYRKYTIRFLKATRWYKDIPMKFVELSLQDLTQKKNEYCLDILAVLVHGETFTKIIEPLIPVSKTIDVHHEEAKINYSLVEHAVNGMKYANPPVSLKILSRLCEGDYLSLTLRALVNVCRKTNATDMMSFAKMLSGQRVSVRKHGIRLMHMIAPDYYYFAFLQEQWNKEENYSIREILFSKVKEMFQQQANNSAWSLLSQLISTLTVKDEQAYFGSLSLINSTPDEYVVDFIKLSLNTIDKFQQNGVKEWKISSYVSNLLNHINAAICNLLPEDFVKELIRRFLFHPDVDVSRCAGMFVVTALLLPAKDKFDDRMKLFSSVFTELVEQGWNVPHPKDHRFYPVNNALQRFVVVVTHTISFLDMELRLIDGILSSFLSVLKPQMDATSYLLLLFSRDHMSSKTPMEFGTKLGQRMPELVEIFTPLFIFFMADTLQCMRLNTFKDYDGDEAELGVIEGLTEVGSIEASLMAVKLLSAIKLDENTERYDKLMTKFSKYDHPAIKSIVCDIINKRLRKTTIDELVPIVNYPSRY